MATDDPTAVNLPRLNVPSAPPPQPASTDPMEGLKDMARNAANSARAQFAPQPRPPVAPLLGPDAGSTVLPVLQDVDKFTRDKNAEALSTARRYALSSPSVPIMI